MSADAAVVIGGGDSLSRCRPTVAARQATTHFCVKSCELNTQCSGLVKKYALGISCRDLSTAASWGSIRPLVLEIARGGGGGVGSNPLPKAVMGTEIAQEVPG